MKKDSESSMQHVSIVVPCYNETESLDGFYDSLKGQLGELRNYSFELIFVDDGSSDKTLDKLHRLADKDKSVEVIALSRNFGKEVALAAGIDAARGDAVIMIDGDGQHPVELIPEFLDAWQAGNDVVIGARKANHKEGPVKRYGSKLFYKLFNKTSSMELKPGSTDYRLIDRSVREVLVTMHERNRMTRGLIDWLGFKRHYIYFEAHSRMAGEASYSVPKLIGLAVNSVVSLSNFPLYIATYTGALITPISLLLLVIMGANDLTGDSLGWEVTGTAYLVVMILLLVGILLISQGILGLYLSHIHADTQGRPLYVINKQSSRLKD